MNLIRGWIEDGFCLTSIINGTRYHSRGAGKKRTLRFPLNSYFSVLIALSIRTSSTILMATFFFPSAYIGIVCELCGS